MAEAMKILRSLGIKNPDCNGYHNDREQTLQHKQILLEKPFLRRLYISFYQQLRDNVPYRETTKPVIVEIGSGSGFLKDIIPHAIASDVLELPGVDLTFSACQMPFKDRSIDAIIMFNVLHHIPLVRSFFKEATRCLKQGGRIIMIEPANTLWGNFIYRNFHHEGFDIKAGWEFKSSGPLLTANGALPWIIFHRDKKLFEKEFPALSILKTYFHTPIKYLLSGGFTLRCMVPSWSYPFFSGIEAFLNPLRNFSGMFETIVIQKILDPIRNGHV